MRRLAPRIPRIPRMPTRPRAAAPATPVAPPPPAATDPVAQERPSFRDRGRLRRRLRYLRRVRELGFRDLGGLVFDQHRFGRRDEALVDTKVSALGQVDGELRAIERALRDERPLTELREAGVSACARCGGLIPSDARFCSNCGTPVHEARHPPAAPEQPAAPPAAEPAALPPAPSPPVEATQDLHVRAEGAVGADAADAPTTVERPDGEASVAGEPRGDDPAAARP